MAASEDGALSPLVIVAIATAAGLTWHHFRAPAARPPLSPTRVEAAPSAPPEASAAPPLPARDPVTEVLEPIASRIGAEGAAYGVTVSAGELRGRYDWPLKQFREGTYDGQTPESLGLPPRDTVPFDEGDKGKGDVKCLKDGQWTFMGSVPAGEDGYSECRWSLRGARTSNAGNYTIMEFNATLHRWGVLHWSAKRRVWSGLRDDEHRQALQSLLATKYSTSPADDGSVTRAVDRLNAARAAGDERAAASASEMVKNALISRHEYEIKAEAARAAVAELDAP